MTPNPVPPVRSSTLWARLGIALTISVLTVVACRWNNSLGPRNCAFIGIACFIGLAALCSTNLRRVNWRTIGTGFALQVGIAVVILTVDNVYNGFRKIGDAVAQFLNFGNEGARFVFGPLANPETMEKALGPKNGFVFAFVALPTVIFVSSFFTILYHARILQAIVWVFAKGMLLVFGRRGVSGAETLSATANVFMGQTEAPLIVKPYVPRMTQSELLALMIGGMATISGGVMAVYIGMGADPVAILATSVMAAPAGLYLAKLLLPETEEPETRGKVKMFEERPHRNVIDAAAAGASDGMHLVLNIAAMLIAFIAIIAMFNHLLKQVHVPSLVNTFPFMGSWGLPDQLTLQWIFGRVFAPVAVLMGVPGGDVFLVGEVLGIKLVLNEFVAYTVLTSPDMAKQMSREAFVLSTFALTGFANFASIGIQLGGIGAMAPTRRGDLARLGLRALLGGFLATLINASIAGILLSLK